MPTRTSRRTNTCTFSAHHSRQTIQPSGISTAEVGKTHQRQPFAPKMPASLTRHAGDARQTKEAERSLTIPIPILPNLKPERLYKATKPHIIAKSSHETGDGEGSPTLFALLDGRGGRGVVGGRGQRRNLNHVRALRRATIDGWAVETWDGDRRALVLRLMGVVLVEAAKLPGGGGPDAGEEWRKKKRRTRGERRT
ncbi:hypothetical protein BC567DRAFT_226768 [Phyllosticta citribraziliensis]